MTVRDKRAWSARLVARQVGELTLSRWLRWRALVPDERLSSIVFEVTLSASLAHLSLLDQKTDRWIGLDDARLLGRPVTAMAVSQSMGMSHTTVRRKTADLVAAGFLTCHAEGFLVAESAFRNGFVDRLIVGDTADLVRCLHALAATDYAPAAAVLQAKADGLPPGVIARLLFAFVLRTMETTIDLYGDMTTAAIMSSIVAMNVRHITGNVVLSLRYACEDVPPPDALRCPVSIRALAREIGSPFETVRRRVADLLATGRVDKKDDGVIVPARVLLSDRHLENNRRINRYFDQMLATLAGLDAWNDAGTPIPLDHGQTHARAAGPTATGVVLRTP